ncbi:hypothetical protein FOL47_008997 [Perkinsus chesapeaki]|uniref:RPGR-interacting protein 1 first C2 domain-containing protein n=1 Tax=Perkinsus chesapeaki TaxID=330153 RepID=A0A7J6MT50_PERCH|nr:hypothetical protein FOL47_008997 [Perkinsus chesapeaki]
MAFQPRCKRLGSLLSGCKSSPNLSEIRTLYAKEQDGLSKQKAASAEFNKIIRHHCDVSTRNQKVMIVAVTMSMQPGSVDYRETPVDPEQVPEYKHEVSRITRMQAELDGIRHRIHQLAANEKSRYTHLMERQPRSKKRSLSVSSVHGSAVSTFDGWFDQYGRPKRTANVHEKYLSFVPSKASTIVRGTCVSPRNLGRDSEQEMRLRIQGLEEELHALRSSERSPRRPDMYVCFRLAFSERVWANDFNRVKVRLAQQQMLCWWQKLEESEARRQELHDEIVQIAHSSFGQQSESRAVLQKRVNELQEEVHKVKSELKAAQQRADGLEAELKQKDRGAEDVQQRILLLTEENNRMRAEADTYSSHLASLEPRLNFLLPSLSEEDKSQLKLVISGLVNSRPGALPSLTAGSIIIGQGIEQLSSTEGMAADRLAPMVDVLRNEKAELVDEIHSLRKMLQIEAGMSNDLRKMMEASSAESRERAADLIKVGSLNRHVAHGVQERDKWQRLASSRDLQIKELQKKLAQSRRSHIPASISEALSAGSDGGFSDLSEIPDLSLNSLDVILGKASLDAALIRSMGFPIKEGESTDTLMSVVLVSFYDFGLCISDAAAGLCPNYRTTLSFPGLDMIHDSKLWNALEAEGLKLDLEAFQVGITAAAGGTVIGTAHVSLYDLLRRSAEPNPAIKGEAIFTVPGSTHETIASVKYKIRFRHPIVDHFEQWKHRLTLEGGIDDDAHRSGEYRSAMSSHPPDGKPEAQAIASSVVNSAKETPRSVVSGTPLPSLSSIIP